MSFGASFTAIGIFASSVTRNQMVAGMLSFSLITLYLAIMAFSYGDPSEVSTNSSFEELIQSIGGSLNNGLDKLQFFAVGIIHIPTILHQLIVVFLFLFLATLQVERIRH